MYGHGHPRWACVGVHLAAYAWALPNTLLGGLVGACLLLSGGRMQWHQGVVEIHGGWMSRVLQQWLRSRQRGALCAMTLGHVILALDLPSLHTLRSHEHVHVRQYETWGPLFLPAYALSSLWQLLQGRSAYRHNFFERQAYAMEADLPKSPVGKGSCRGATRRHILLHYTRARISSSRSGSTGFTRW